MNVLVIAANAVRRLLRDRASLFFVFVFPLVLIVLLGSSVGGEPTFHLVVSGPTDGPFSGAVVAQLEDAERLDLTIEMDVEQARQAVARGRVHGALVLPDDFDAALATGRTVEAAYIAGNRETSPLLRAPVDAALRQVGAVVAAADLAVELTGATPASALEEARRIQPLLPAARVSVSTVGDQADDPLAAYDDLGPMGLITHQELLLFTFLTSLTAASALIQSRQLGVSRRMLATPTTVGTILLGEATGRFAVAMVQALYIVVGTAVLFGVDWGQVSGWVPLVTLFALVSSAAGMLMGASFRNDSQASGLGIFFGLALAAIGGCMLPLELFSPTMRTIAHVTPHAWALDGFRDLVVTGGGLADVANELAVLAGYAGVLLAAATIALRRSLLRSV